MELSTGKRSHKSCFSTGKTTVSLYVSGKLLEEARGKGINLSKLFENALIQEINRVSQTESRNGGNLGGEAPGLVRPPGFEPGLPAWQALEIRYSALRSDFLVYLGRYDPRTASCMLSYLDRFVGGKVIRDPLDVAGFFNGLSAGQHHQLDRALRALLNFCLLKGYPEDWIRLLKKAIPREPPLIDLRVPEEHEVAESLKRVEFIPLKYRALWVLCLESGLRVVEAASLINDFSPERITRLNGFFRYQIGAFRGSKQVYFAYFTGESLGLIKANRERVIEANASHYYAKYGILAPKYLRKFAFDRMVELGIPESVADFIEGRAPRRIGARHYMSLVRQADSYYPRYAEYLRQLRGF